MSNEEGWKPATDAGRRMLVDVWVNGPLSHDQTRARIVAIEDEAAAAIGSVTRERDLLMVKVAALTWERDYLADQQARRADRATGVTFDVVAASEGRHPWGTNGDDHVHDPRFHKCWCGEKGPCGRTGCTYPAGCPSWNERDEDEPMSPTDTRD